MAQIPMECPKCKRWGSVPSNKINTTLRCRKCLSAFYLNSAGIAILGEAPLSQEEVDAQKKAAKKKKKDVEVDFNFLEDWKETFNQYRSRVLGFIALVAVVAAGASYYMNAARSDPIKERAVYVARLFA